MCGQPCTCAHAWLAVIHNFASVCAWLDHSSSLEIHISESFGKSTLAPKCVESTCIFAIQSIPKEKIHFCRAEYSKLRGLRWALTGTFGLVNGSTVEHLYNTIFAQGRAESGVSVVLPVVDLPPPLVPLSGCSLPPFCSRYCVLRIPDSYNAKITKICKSAPTWQNSSFTCNFPQFWRENSSFTCNFPQFCHVGNGPQTLNILRVQTKLSITIAGKQLCLETLQMPP